ncbi:hypothetical protein ACFYXC_40565, partial [Streptomyces sp. NPDC002701]
TFLLWRRMKLWELRSYEQVIKLEQERLVYQASLRSRFGRTWRRKAPVEALIPLRLARYGVPLAETAPAGLAAAGIEEPPIQFTVERAPIPAQPDNSTADAGAEHEHTAAELESTEPQPLQASAPTPVPERPRDPEESTKEVAERFAEAYQAFLTQFHAEPTPTQWAFWLRDTYGISTGSGDPLSEDKVQPLLQVLQERYGLRAEEPDPSHESQATGQVTDQWYDYFQSAWRTFAQEHGTYPDAAALAAYVYERDSITGDGRRPITGDDLAAFVASFQERELGSGEPPAEETAADPGEQVAGAGPAEEKKPEAATAGAAAPAAKDKRRPRVFAAIDDRPPDEDEGTEESAELSTVDRYYLAWLEFQTQRGDELSSSTREAEQLSAFLADKGMHGRGGKPVSPSNLRRYLLPFRVYNLWAEQRMRSDTPSLDATTQECAAQGITAQHNKPITTAYIADQVEDFERRWQALTHHHAQAQQ